MENARQDRSGKMLDLLDRSLQAGAWSGIVLSRMLRNMLPPSLKRDRRRRPYFIDDRRQGRRLRVDRAVTCRGDGQDATSARIINISRNGMYVETDAPSDVGRELSFNLSGRNLGPFMRVRGRVTRRAEHGMAIRFV